MWLGLRKINQFEFQASWTSVSVANNRRSTLFMGKALRQTAAEISQRDRANRQSSLLDKRSKQFLVSWVWILRTRTRVKASVARAVQFRLSSEIMKPRITYSNNAASAQSLQQARTRTVSHRQPPDLTQILDRPNRSILESLQRMPPVMLTKIKIKLSPLNVILTAPNLGVHTVWLHSMRPKLKIGQQRHWSW